MKAFAISDDRLTLQGLRLTGIEGRQLTERAEILTEIEAIERNSDYGILIITRAIAALVPEKVQELKLSGKGLLITVIPVSHDSKTEKDSITKLMR